MSSKSPIRSSGVITTLASTGKGRGLGCTPITPITGTPPEGDIGGDVAADDIEAEGDDRFL